MIRSVSSFDVMLGIRLVRLLISVGLYSSCYEWFLILLILFFATTINTMDTLWNVATIETEIFILFSVLQSVCEVTRPYVAKWALQIRPRTRARTCVCVCILNPKP